MFLIEKHDPHAPDDSGDERWEVETVEELAPRIEDLTGVALETILSDFDDEDCLNCYGAGKVSLRGPGVPRREEFVICDTCDGTGKAMNSGEWTDSETGIEVTARRA